MINNVDNGGHTSSSIESHPVIVRLHQLEQLAQKLDERVEAKVDTLSDQMDTLVKASDIMMNGANDKRQGDSKADDESESKEESLPEQTSIPEIVGNVHDAPKATAVVSTSISASSEEEESDDDDDEVAMQTKVMNEAQFGLRPQEVGMQQQGQKKTTQQARRPRRAVPLDFGDEEPQDERLTKKASVSLASTINTIEQRSAVRSRKKRQLTETLDDQGEDNEALRRGLEMMEAELGRLESDDEGDKDGEMDDIEVDEELDESDFYGIVKKKSEAKKQQKAAKYAVAPKYPGMDQEIQGTIVEITISPDGSVSSHMLPAILTTYCLVLQGNVPSPGLL